MENITCTVHVNPASFHISKVYLTYNVGLLDGGGGGGVGNFTNYKENEKERNNMMSLLHKRQNACLIKSLISSVTNRE